MTHSKKDVSGSTLGRLFLCPWMGGIPQGARTAVRLRPWIGSYVAKSQGWRCDECPGMDGQIFNSCKICTSAFLGGRIPQRARKAARLCLLYFTVLAATNQPVWAGTACHATQYDETTIIKYIHDGDTLHLKDGRKVRLIGINTPEVAHGDNAAEPFSAQAKDALNTLFSNKKKISLIYGKEKQDRYGRLLAHVFTDDGSNVQAALLEQGFARAVTFPPNTQYSVCYLQQEREARCARAGLWKKTKPLAAKNLDNTHIGFQLVKGKLNNISTNKKGTWLKLDNKLTVGIRPENQQLFDITAMYKLLDENVVVRGWLNKSKKESPYYMRIRHPSAIESADTFVCH